MNILGISAFYHDSAAALVNDERIVAAAQEERFSRIKHDPSFPRNAIDFCLRYAGLQVSDLDYVVFYEKSLLKLDRLMETYLAFAPSGFASFTCALPEWINRKLFIRREIRKSLGGKFHGRILFPEHHQSHAASAFLPSPFEDAAILTIDGVGEWSTTSLGYGKGNKIQLLREIPFPHSLGLLYSAFTYFTGFRVNSGEYKLMGLAPYGTAKYSDLIREKLVKIYDDGSFQLDLSYFNYCQGLTMTNGKFAALFGGAPRAPESEITQREMDLAASIQEVTEEIILKMAKHARETTGCPRLCMAGGVALNCSANGKLYRSGLFDEIWVQPASGDAGGALGAALFAKHQLLNAPRVTCGEDFQQGSFLGNAYSPEEILPAIARHNLPFQQIARRETLMETVAGLLNEGKVVGLFQGRMEFGPRALGGRSILGNPCIENMQSRINLKIKFRESFRPFAPAVTEENAEEYFDYHAQSPYMLMIAPVQESKLYALSDSDRKKLREDKDMNARLNLRRSSLQAVTHVDNSARLQTVDAKRNPFLHALLAEFKKRSGCPVLVNTSFNIRGEPIVCSPEDAIHCFLHTDMDILVMENIIVRKDRNAPGETDAQYRKKFKLD
ncbi:MAG: carbamoyltransferase [Victivallaceae bacterium]|nr:carbamoyltransferase [Victivallaceae bacterium]